MDKKNMLVCAVVATELAITELHKENAIVELSDAEENALIKCTLKFTEMLLSAYSLRGEYSDKDIDIATKVITHIIWSTEAIEAGIPIPPVATTAFKKVEKILPVVIDSHKRITISRP